MLKDFTYQNKVRLNGVGIFTITANDFDGLAGRFKAVGNCVTQLVGESLAFTARGLVTDDDTYRKASAQLIGALIAGHLVSYGVQRGLITLRFTQVEPAQADS